MAVKIKEAVKAKAKVSPVTEQVDALYALEAEIKALEKQLAPLSKAFSEKRSELAEVVKTTTKPEDKALLEGTKADLEFGVVPDTVVSVDLKLGRSLLGEKTFMEIAKINIGDLEKYLTEDEFKKCVKRDRVGTRRIKWNPK
jgi:hypothetical protein